MPSLAVTQTHDAPGATAVQPVEAYQPPEPTVPEPSSSVADPRRLLRSRLRMLTGPSACAFGLIAAAFGVAFHWIVDPAAVGPAPRAAAWFGAVANALAFAALTAGRGWSERTLRAVGYAVLVADVGFLAVWQYGKLTADLGPAIDPVTAVELAHFHGLAVILPVTLAFGLLIPDRPLRVLGIGLGIVAVWGGVTVAALAGRPLPAGTVRLLANASTGLFALSIGLSYGAVRSLTGLREQVRQLKEVGPYRLVEAVGRGGMGEVWRAEHRLLKRTCAVKLILPQNAADPTALKRFEREASLAARVRHPNVVEVYDYGRHPDGSFYCVTEFLTGLTLDELVKRHGPVPPGRAVHLLRQALRGLAEAHRAGLVHRDVKPANLFVSPAGGGGDWVKVLDFGLVREVADTDDSRLTRAGVILGTPAYMAPEQIDGRAPVGPAADLYAVAAVAHFLLAGQPPFPRESVMETVAAQLRDPPPPLPPGVPADLAAVVARGLTKTPGGRYTDAAAMERALADCGCADAWADADAAGFWVERGTGERPA